MHSSSIDNLRFALQKHVLPDPALGTRTGLKVLEVGSADFNGGYRQVLELLECHYTGVDLEPGDGVDIVLDDPYILPFPDSSFAKRKDKSGAILSRLRFATSLRNTPTASCHGPYGLIQDSTRVTPACFASEAIPSGIKRYESIG